MLKPRFQHFYVKIGTGGGGSLHGRLAWGLLSFQFIFLKNYEIVFLILHKHAVGVASKTVGTANYLLDMRLTGA